MAITQNMESVEFFQLNTSIAGTFSSPQKTKEVPVQELLLCDFLVISISQFFGIFIVFKADLYHSKVSLGKVKAEMVNHQDIDNTNCIKNQENGTIRIQIISFGSDFFSSYFSPHFQIILINAIRTNIIAKITYTKFDTITQITFKYSPNQKIAPLVHIGDKNMAIRCAKSAINKERRDNAYFNIFIIPFIPSSIFSLEPGVAAKATSENTKNHKIIANNIIIVLLFIVFSFFKIEEIIFLIISYLVFTPIKGKFLKPKLMISYFIFSCKKMMYFFTQ
jgi:hypothetical protein